MQSLNISVQFYVLLCNERPSPNFYWQIFIFLYLAVLQIVGILLAFQTRKVKVHGLRDSKFIAAIIYISSIVLVVLALVVFALRVYINTGAGIYASGVLVLTTTILFLIFIPKVLMFKAIDNDMHTVICMSVLIKAAAVVCMVKCLGFSLNLDREVYTCCTTLVS